MGSEIVYCSLCGTRILEKDLISGRAFTLLDKTFCADCKAQAFAQMDGGDSGAARQAPARAVQPSAARRPAPAAARPAPRPAPRAYDPAPEEDPGAFEEEPPQPVPVRAVRRRRNYAPIYVGAFVGFAGLVVALILLINTENRNRREKEREIIKKHEEEQRTGTHDTPDLKAARLLQDLQEAARQNPDPADMLRKIREAEIHLAGSSSDEEFRALRKRWEAKAVEKEASKQLEEILVRIRKMVQEDGATYTRYDQIKQELARARELAVQKTPERKPDVEALEREYVEPYEERARAWSAEKAAYLSQLTTEGNDKAVVQIIDRFPQELRRSDVWKQLKRQKEDAEKRLAAKNTGQDARDWKYWIRLGHEDLRIRNYSRSKENYVKGLAMAPARESLTQDEKKSVAWCYFNVGCIHGIEAKTKEGEEQKKEVDQAFEWLTKACVADVFKFACNCHGKPTEHWEKDEDLEVLRKDPRYAKLIEKYAK